jgi:hypothetical protein
MEKIVGSKKQIMTLYEMLKCRNHNISHIKTPTYAQHKQFVINNPYRAWFLISNNSGYIGSFYIQKNNSVSISLIRNNTALLNEIFSFIILNYKPLKEVKSIRPPYFYINLAPTNKYLISYLKLRSFKHLQCSFKIPSGID